jgi:CHAD domain-containing protein
VNERAYRLHVDEPLPEGIARIARGRFDHAIEELDGSSRSAPAEAVHNARKDIKKLRSLIRLVRGELGPALAREENAALRETAALLSGPRDADVMVETLEGLGLPSSASGPLRQALEAHRIRTAGGARGEAGAQAIEALSTARARVVDWPIERDSFAVVAPGLRRAYRRGRRELRAVRREATAEELHEWRKRVKDLWYHHELLRFVWKPVMAAVADEAHELANHLGDDHDLAMLLAWAREHAEAPPALVEAVDARRAGLQADALLLGARLYFESPGDFVSRIGSWWEAARRAP